MRAVCLGKYSHWFNVATWFNWLLHTNNFEGTSEWQTHGRAADYMEKTASAGSVVNSMVGAGVFSLVRCCSGWLLIVIVSGMSRLRMYNQDQSVGLKVIDHPLPYTTDLRVLIWQMTPKGNQSTGTKLYTPFGYNPGINSPLYLYIIMP